jgi:hypothetical protein
LARNRVWPSVHAAVTLPGTAIEQPGLATSGFFYPATGAAVDGRGQFCPVLEDIGEGIYITQSPQSLHTFSIQSLSSLHPVSIPIETPLDRIRLYTRVIGADPAIIGRQSSARAVIAANSKE